MQFFILLKLKQTNQAEYMRDHWTAARKGRLLLFVQRHYIQHTVADVVVSLCSPLSWSCCVRLLSYHSLATHWSLLPALLCAASTQSTSRSFGMENTTQI